MMILKKTKISRLSLTLSLIFHFCGTRFLATLCTHSISLLPPDHCFNSAGHQDPLGREKKVGKIRYTIPSHIFMYVYSLSWWPSLIVVSISSFQSFSFSLLKLFVSLSMPLILFCCLKEETRGFEMRYEETIRRRRLVMKGFVYF